MRLGILGGSFNPVHAAHIRLGVEVLEQLGLDGVELIPAADPYHKHGLEMLPYDLRFRLVEAAAAEVPGLAASSLERGMGGPSYTCDVLAEWRRGHPNDIPYFILGAENVLDLPQWKNGQDLLLEIDTAVVLRGGVGMPEVEAFLAGHYPDVRKDAGVCRFSSGTSMHFVDMPRMDISSTDIRARRRAGRSPACLVPKVVERMLEESASELDRAWGPVAPVQS